MAKTYENESPWSSAAKVTLIGQIAVLGDLWQPGMSDEEVATLYQSVMNPPDENPGKMEEL